MPPVTLGVKVTYTDQSFTAETDKAFDYPPSREDWITGLPYMASHHFPIAQVIHSYMSGRALVIVLVRAHSRSDFDCFREKFEKDQWKIREPNAGGQTTTPDSSQGQSDQ